jgi:hypothetical protein
MRLDGIGGVRAGSLVIIESIFSTYLNYRFVYEIDNTYYLASRNTDDFLNHFEEVTYL